MPRRKPLPEPEPLTTTELVEKLAAQSEVVRYTLKEVASQLSHVEDLIVEGAGTGQIIRVMQQRFAGITKVRVKNLIARVTETHAKEDAEARTEWKAAQIRRLHQYRRQAAGTPQLAADGSRIGWLVKPDHKAIIAYERLLAQICGTLEAVKVDVDVRYTEAMLSVVAQMTGEDAAEYLFEAQENERLATVARKLLPAHVTDGEIVETDSVNP